MLIIFEKVELETVFFPFCIISILGDLTPRF